jgi:four helix bundle protein
VEEPGHKKLDVWNRAVSFVTRVYEVTCGYPREELYGIVSQMRRAALSIPCNISEGAARQSTKEYVRFLYVSLSSASELNVQITVSKNLNYLTEAEYSELIAENDEISKMLMGLIKSLKGRLKR